MFTHRDVTPVPCRSKEKDKEMNGQNVISRLFSVALLGTVAAIAILNAAMPHPSLFAG